MNEYLGYWVTYSRDPCGEMNASFVVPSREFDTRAQALLFGTVWQRLFISFELSQTKFSVIRLVDTLLLDEFDWLIVL